MITARSLIVIGGVALGAMILEAQAPTEGPPTDKVTRLGQQLERGEATLEYRAGTGYLPSLLEHLDINIDSQTLVFSKTSFQQSIINPRNPRALYFNDEVSVGTVPGGDVYELLALEPSHGIVFYSLSTKETERPRLQRRGIECLFCHAMGNKGAPSLVVASVFPDPDGVPAYTSTFISTIDHRTPFEQRWGGWYVTGTHGSQKHRGNAVASDPLRPLDLELSGTPEPDDPRGQVRRIQISRRHQRHRGADDAGASSRSGEPDDGAHVPVQPYPPRRHERRRLGRARR